MKQLASTAWTHGQLGQSMDEGTVWYVRSENCSPEEVMTSGPDICLTQSEEHARLFAAAPAARELIRRAESNRIDDQWLKEARAYLKATGGVV